MMAARPAAQPLLRKPTVPLGRKPKPNWWQEDDEKKRLDEQEDDWMGGDDPDGGEKTAAIGRAFVARLEKQAAMGGMLSGAMGAARTAFKNPYVRRAATGAALGGGAALLTGGSVGRGVMLGAAGGAGYQHYQQRKDGAQPAGTGRG